MTQVNTITKSHKGTDLTYAEMKQIEAYKKLNCHTVRLDACLNAVHKRSMIMLKKEQYYK